MRLCFEAQSRVSMNRSRLKQLRQAGNLPCVVFGLEAASDMIQISSKQFGKWIRTGRSEIVDLNIDGNQKVPVMLKHAQRDPVTRDWVHADFLRVRMDEIIRMKVPLEFVGTPAGVTRGGVLSVQETHIEVEGLPGDIPATIAVDVSQMEVGESLLFDQLPKPDKAVLVPLADEIVASIVLPRK
ncbi:50S ribosomal protein L25 [Paenibacillus sp. GYB004]|uniref:50S ribosomal protein L25 n=1 Tax=unclassified Paenibacillus TaxID=185978 RepID=UPI002F964560